MIRIRIKQIKRLEKTFISATLKKNIVIDSIINSKIDI